MNQDELKLQIGAGITRMRKAHAMTQAELAERLNYSDKAVSKWERGESVPDVLTLTQIAAQFGVTVNELVYGEAVPESRPTPVPQADEPFVDEVDAVIRHNRRIIQGLVSILVWIVALTFYVVLDSFGVPYVWLTFVLAVPAHAITLLSLRSAWKMFGWNLVLISIIMWGSLIFIHAVAYLASSVNIWRMFLMGVLGQAAIVLWFKLVKKPKEKKYG